ncbi:Protein-tyrosine phosphatase [Nitrosopumilaceae archaeon]|nr:dual specificity protein phosphatase family protein [Nitrosopumilus sp.]CAI9830859.1 Protein-tyrosine phosphatase [Nitrosopumilaceae archaeon]MDA7944553.1 dual specificity protein phosphatase family protein [Nitrosopumilus sp.]MDA7954305.1 dual specificity protein phosphatase family protein [Nitrosopumilus sp.]MDA7973099.1 dual specificity protein phosphatase family protein [Nitrosopumilus sp.]
MSAPGNAWRRTHGLVTGRPTNFSWVEEGRLAGCGLPTSAAEVRWLHGQGIRAIVTVREVPLPDAWLDGIEYLFVRTDDMRAPAPGQIEQAMEFLAGQERAGRPAVVHCAAGIGRTGTVLASYMVSRGMRAPDAIRALRQRRPGSIQSPEQEEAVRLYESRSGRAG